MSRNLKIWRVYCVTEGGWIEATQNQEPTVCPNNAGHAIRSIQLVDPAPYINKGDIRLFDGSTEYTLTGGAPGNFLKLDSNTGTGAIWDKSMLDQLGDVDLNNKLPTDTLVFNGSKWVNAKTLSGVNINNPARDETLIFDGSKWVNKISFVSRTFDAYFDNGITPVPVGFAFTNIPLNIQNTIDPTSFYHVVGEAVVQILKKDKYNINGRITLDLNYISGQGRTNAQGRLVLSTDGVNFIEVPGTVGASFHRDLTQGQGTIIVSSVLNLEVGNKIKMQAVKNSVNGSSTLILLNNACSLNITKA